MPSEVDYTLHVVTIPVDPEIDAAVEAFFNERVGRRPGRPLCPEDTPASKPLTRSDLERAKADFDNGPWCPIELNQKLLRRRTR